MKLIFKICLILTFSLSSVLSETFNTALRKAYETNPELNAERESINISEQELKVSKSSYLPTITLEGSRSQEQSNSSVHSQKRLPLSANEKLENKKNA